MSPELELLKVADLAKQWPNLRPIHDLAMARLSDLAIDAQNELDSRAKAKYAAEAKAQAVADAKAKARADAEAKAAEAKPTPTDVRVSGEGQTADQATVTEPTAPPAIERRE